MYNSEFNIESLMDNNFTAFENLSSHHRNEFVNFHYDDCGYLLLTEETGDEYLWCPSTTEWVNL